MKTFLSEKKRIIQSIDIGVASAQEKKKFEKKIFFFVIIVIDTSYIRFSWIPPNLEWKKWKKDEKMASFKKKSFPFKENPEKRCHILSMKKNQGPTIKTNHYNMYQMIRTYISA